MRIRFAIPGLPIAAPDPMAVSLGGSETAGLQLAAELVRQGHDVTVAANVAQPFDWRGVRLQPGFTAEEMAAPCDLFIGQRSPETLQARGAARASALSLHDLIRPDMAAELVRAQDIATIAAVSDWHRQQCLKVVPGLDPDRLIVLQNGVDRDLIRSASRRVPRDPFRIAYISRPERGLDVMLRHVFPRILAHEPRATLHVASYDVPILIHLGPLHREVEELARGLGDRVTMHPPLGKRELYRMLAGCGLLLYPTPSPIDRGFAETSCIAAMEAVACGCVVVTTDRGALPDTVRCGGVIVPLDRAKHAGEPMVAQRLADEALRVMHDWAHAERLRRAGLERAAALGWAPVAEQLVAAVARIEHAPAKPAVLRGRLKVVVCTPCYAEMVHAAYTTSLLATQAQLAAEGIEFAYLNAGSSSIAHGRNALAARARATDASHIAWVDSDLKFPADAISRLLRHQVEFVAVPYRLKTDPVEFNFTACSDARGHTRRLPTGPIECTYAPSGFALLRPVVYDQVAAAYPEGRLAGIQQPGDLGPIATHDFYSHILANGILLTEDYSFCHRWRATGGIVWADLSIQLTHHGQHGYTADPRTVFQIEDAQAA